jgi:ArsR family transcriptional regulator
VEPPATGRRGDRLGVVAESSSGPPRDDVDEGRCRGVIWHRPKYGGAEINRIYKALADPTRRSVLAMLRERDMTAGELAAEFDLSWPTMSGHFAVLRDADLVVADRTGTSITYRLNLSVLEEALAALMDTFKLQPKESR